MIIWLFYIILLINAFVLSGGVYKFKTDLCFIYLCGNVIDIGFRKKILHYHVKMSKIKYS